MSFFTFGNDCAYALKVGDIFRARWYATYVILKITRFGMSSIHFHLLSPTGAIEEHYFPLSDSVEIIR
jgi:hypothetical protein